MTLEELKKNLRKTLGNRTATEGMVRGS